MFDNPKQFYTDVAEAIALKLPDPNINVVVSEQTNDTFDNWISYRFVNWRQIGTSLEDYTNLEESNTSVEYETESLFAVDLRMIFCGVRSEELALRYAHNFNKQTYQSAYRALGLGFNFCSPIKSAPKASNNGWEQRHILDVRFNIVVRDVDSLNFWHSVVLTQEIEDQTGDVIFTRTDEIDLET